MKNMYQLRSENSNNELLKARLINIDAITVNYSKDYEIIKRFMSSDKALKNDKIYIISENNILKKKPWKEKVLYLEDKKFFDIFTRNDKVLEKEKYKEQLKKSYINLLKHNIYAIKKHPIYNMIKRSKMYGEDYDVSYLTDRELDFLFNIFYKGNGYKKYRDLYFILKSNNFLDKSLKYSTDEEDIDNSKYYLYLKDICISGDKDNFFKDKILIKEGTLQDIDDYTIKYNSIEELGLNSFGNNRQIVLTGEGVIISDATRNILERKLKGKPIFYEVLLSSDKNFYDRMTSLDFVQRNEFNSLRERYLSSLLDDEETTEEFIDRYRDEIEQDLSDGIDYKELIILLNMKTMEVNYPMARYMYMERKKSDERVIIKYRNERNRRLH